MKTPRTRTLVEAAQTGDRRALETLVEKYSSRLEAVVHVRLGPRLRQRVGIDDVCQDTWLKAVGSIRQFRWCHEQSFFRWLAGIAEHVIKNHARYHLHTQKRNGAQEIRLSQALKDASGRSGHVASFLARRGTSPNDALRREERFERLERALNRLTEDHREVIVLARLHGFSRKEIGERMNRSEDAVSMLLLRALRQLGEHFGRTDSCRLPPRSLEHAAGGEREEAGRGQRDSDATTDGGKGAALRSLPKKLGRHHGEAS